MISLEFVRLQTVFFLTSLNLTNKLNLALNLRDASNNLFDTDPTILPIPDDVPEMPKLALRSRDKLWAYQVANRRFEFVFELSPDKFNTVTFEEAVEQHAQLGNNIWETLQTKHDASGSRIGVVSTFVSLGSDLVKELRSALMQPSNAPDPRELQLYALHKLPLDNINVNRWVRCSAGSPQTNLEANSLLRVEIDFNTIPQEKFDLTTESIEWFVKRIGGEVLNVKASLFSSGSANERIF